MPLPASPAISGWLFPMFFMQSVIIHCGIKGLIWLHEFSLSVFLLLALYLLDLLLYFLPKYQYAYLKAFHLFLISFLYFQIRKITTA
jgi:hypothetical protein